VPPPADCRNTAGGGVVEEEEEQIQIFFQKIFCTNNSPAQVLRFQIEENIYHDLCRKTTCEVSRLGIPMGLGGVVKKKRRNRSVTVSSYIQQS
jgi:hypothetical protein